MQERATEVDFRRLDEEISVQHHSAVWREWFLEEVVQIRDAFGAHAVGYEHVGSSAIAGLDSKPIVDILVGLGVFEIPAILGESLSRLGYEYFGQLHVNSERCFARKRGDRSFNLQIVPFNSTEWMEKLAFRDYLRTHSDVVARYSRVKREAIDGGNTNLLAYHKFKDACVVEILKEALDWRKSELANCESM